MLLQANFQQEASSRLQANAANARKYFTMLAEAVKINENIDDEIKICGLLKLLERIEKGEFQIFEVYTYFDIITLIILL